MAQPLWKTNTDILAALALVIDDLPDRIKELTLTLTANQMPELRITQIVRLPRKSEPGLYVKEIDTRYRLVPIEQEKGDSNDGEPRILGS